MKAIGGPQPVWHTNCIVLQLKTHDVLAVALTIPVVVCWTTMGRSGSAIWSGSLPPGRCRPSGRPRWSTIAVRTRRRNALLARGWTFSGQRLQQRAGRSRYGRSSRHDVVAHRRRLAFHFMQSVLDDIADRHDADNAAAVDHRHVTKLA